MAEDRDYNVGSIEFGGEVNDPLEVIRPAKTPSVNQYRFVTPAEFLSDCLTLRQRCPEQLYVACIWDYGDRSARRHATDAFSHSRREGDDVSSSFVGDSFERTCNPPKNRVGQVAERDRNAGPKVSDLKYEWSSLQG